MDHTETELKLSLRPQDVPRLLAHPLLGTPARTEQLLNTYLDTPELALKARRMAVRERRVGERTLLTVKTAGRSVNGLTQRSEWEGPTVHGAPDFAALVDDAELAAMLTGLAPRLRPVFRTDFNRRSWVVEHAGARVEVALDEGSITAGHTEHAPQGSRSETILELELELLEGPPDALNTLARTLEQDGAREAGERWLPPSDLSKAQRGLALFLQVTPTTSS